MAVKDGIEQFDDAPVGDLGSQLFHFDTDAKTFKYALVETNGICLLHNA